MSLSLGHLLTARCSIVSHTPSGSHFLSYNSPSQSNPSLYCLPGYSVAQISGQVTKQFDCLPGINNKKVFLPSWASSSFPGPLIAYLHAPFHSRAPPQELTLLLQLWFLVTASPALTGLPREKELSIPSLSPGSPLWSELLKQPHSTSSGQEAINQPFPRCRA